jgi:predicted alpha/beta-hydrolase family hydrolase
VWNGPAGADTLVVLTHGAGNDMNSDFMTHFATRLSESGRAVCRFNFPYAERGRKTPDRQAVLEASYREVVESARNRHRARRVVLGGKSMGGRIASHIVAAGVPADALVFLGYPLHPPGRPERMRDAHLKVITVPMLFVEGTRDPFCPLDTLERVRPTLRAPTDVVVVEDGDHSLKTRASSGRSTVAAWDEAAAALTSWLDRVGTRSRRSG